MSGTYTITEKIPHESKFACMVSFNGGDAEYYEVESVDPIGIDKELQVVADNHEVMITEKLDKESALELLEVVDGKVVSS